MNFPMGLLGTLVDIVVSTKLFKKRWHSDLSTSQGLTKDKDDDKEDQGKEDGPDLAFAMDDVRPMCDGPLDGHDAQTCKGEGHEQEEREGIPPLGARLAGGAGERGRGGGGMVGRQCCILGDGSPWMSAHEKQLGRKYFIGPPIRSSPLPTLPLSVPFQPQFDWLPPYSRAKHSLTTYKADTLSRL